MKAFFVALGQSAPPLTSLTKHGLQEGDDVYFLIPEGGGIPGRFEASIKMLSDKIGLKAVEVPLDFEAGVAKILRALLEAKHRELIMNLSGAPKLLAMEALMAITLSGLERVRVEIEPGKAVDLRGLLGELGGAEERLLRAVERGPLMLSDAAAEAGLAISSAYRAMERLEGAGLVRTAKEGKKRVIELTPIGRALAKKGERGF